MEGGSLDYRFWFDLVRTMAMFGGLVLACVGLNTWRRQLRGTTEYQLALKVLRAVFAINQHSRERLTSAMAAHFDEQDEAIERAINNQDEFVRFPNTDGHVELRRILYGRGGSTDDFSRRMNDAVKKVETAFRPYLKDKGFLGDLCKMARRGDDLMHK